MGKFHDDGTLEIGGFGGEETTEESSTVSGVVIIHAFSLTKHSPFF